MTPSATPSASPSVTPSATPSVTPSATPSASPSATPSEDVGDYINIIGDENDTGPEIIADLPNNLLVCGDLEVKGSIYSGSSGTGGIDWSGGNVTYVPIDGDIQTYVTAATAGDTLILASGQYVITSTITISKQLNIVGQGNAGFLTTPVTAGHGTLISSTTASIVAFQISSSNVRVANLSIHLTGAASKGVNTAKDLVGLVFTNVDVIVTCSGVAQGFTILSSNVVMRDLTFYITSSDASATGVWLWNNSASTINAVADCFNVTGVVVGGADYAYGLICQNLNDANTLTLNLSNSVCTVITGTVLDVAVASISTATSNSTVNCYMCTLSGATYDAYQNNSNVLNLGGSVLVNNLIFGTVTYRATLASGTGVFGGTLTVGTGSITDSGGAITFGSSDVFWTGDSSGLPYGSCSSGGTHLSWTQVNPVQNTWYDISDSDMVDGQLNLVTHDGNGQLAVTKAGRYLINWSISGESTVANKHLEFAISVNGTESTQGMAHYETKAISTEFHLGSTAILDLAASATINLSIRTIDAGNVTLTVDMMEISVVMVGGT